MLNGYEEDYTLENALLEAVDEMSDEFKKMMSKKLLRVFAEFLTQINVARDDIANGTIKLEDLLLSTNEVDDDTDE